MTHVSCRREEGSPLSFSARLPAPTIRWLDHPRTRDSSLIRVMICDAQLFRHSGVLDLTRVGLQSEIPRVHIRWACLWEDDSM